MNPPFVCRKEASTLPATQTSFCSLQVAQHGHIFWPLQKRGILWYCNVNDLVFHPRKVAASFLPLGPAPCLPGTEPLAPLALGPPGFREASSANCGSGLS